MVSLIGGMMVCLQLLLSTANAFRYQRSLSMNLLGDLFRNQLLPQKPWKDPLAPSLVQKSPAGYVLQEKLFSMSGEDFTVRDIGGRDVLDIDGANINLGGVVLDKLFFKINGAEIFSLERRIITAATAYDLYRNGEQVGKVERQLLSFTPKYVYTHLPAEGGGWGSDSAELVAEGSFSERNFGVTHDGKPVARVGRELFELVKELDNYHLEVAEGVDAAAVIALACVIDEDHDEEDAREEQQKQEDEGGLPWPFG